MTKEDLSVAVIGCGAWGKNLVRNFHGLGALVAVSDPNPDVRERMKAQYGLEAREVDDILADSSIDAVVIAAPAEMHHDLALRAFAANKHVYVEKPIALTLEHAEEMKNAAAEAGLTLMVGHLLQYHPVFLKLKELVQDGELGKLRYIYSRRLNIGKLRTHENVLWSFAPHDISMMLALAGCEPDKVTGFAGNFLQESISDFSTVHMEFPNGIKGHIEASWLNPFKEQRLVVVGDRSMAVFDDTLPWEERLKLYDHKAEIVDGKAVLEPAEARLIEVEETEPLSNECQHFLRFIRNKETPFTDGKEAMAVLRVLQLGDVA